MSAALANPVEMIRQGAPRPIRSEKQLAEYTRMLSELDSKPKPTRDEEDAIELLTLLIEHYEDEHYHIPDASPVDVLRFLLSQHGLTQREIAPELGSETTVSLVLSGKRELTREHITRLSARFHVSPAVFLTKEKN